MKNPKDDITVVAEGATYLIPTYQVSNAGLVDAAEMQLQFCKGNKEDDAVLRQTGVLTESLIEVAKRYLESVNKGDLSCRETSMAITKLDEALMWINKRAEDRKKRGVQQTYKK